MFVLNGESPENRTDCLLQEYRNIHMNPWAAPFRAQNLHSLCNIAYYNVKPS